MSGPELGDIEHDALDALLERITNYGVSIGLQAVRLWPEQVRRLNEFFTR